MRNRGILERYQRKFKNLFCTTSNDDLCLRDNGDHMIKNGSNKGNINKTKSINVIKVSTGEFNKAKLF